MIGQTPAPTESEPSQESSPEPVDRTGASPESLSRPVEIGGRDGPEPTRYGDWEKNGRCIDF